MIYELHIRKETPHELILGLGPGWRITFAVLTAIMLWIVTQTGLAPIPVALALVSVAATLYHERWIILPAESHIESQTGVLFLPKKRTYSTSALRRVVLRHSSSSGPSTTALARESSGVLSRAFEKRIVRLGLDFDPDDSAPGTGRLHGNIVTESERNAARLRELGRRLAQYCEVPFDEV